MLRQGRFEVTVDKAFADVVHNCATVRGRATRGHPWLVPEVQEVYRQLHEQGHAHSVEVWRDGVLVGGELGVSSGGFYSGDSVFFVNGQLNLPAGGQEFSPLVARYFSPTAAR